MYNSTSGTWDETRITLHTDNKLYIIGNNNGIFGCVLKEEYAELWLKSNPFCSTSMIISGGNIFKSNGAYNQSPSDTEPSGIVYH